MRKMKPTIKYYFSVEGETEKWYLEWLQQEINSDESARSKVSIKADVEKNPLKYVKRTSLVGTGVTTIWHLCDYESNEQVHIKQFIETMDRMKDAEKLGKKIRYRFGYSNLTFDLWIILHKADCMASYAHRKQYITPLNKAFGTHFENMDDFKHEDHFKQCLSQLTLKNVRQALKRADKITDRNKAAGYTLIGYKGFHYYKENPSLGINEAIRMILSETGIIR